MVEILRQLVQNQNKVWDKTLSDIPDKFLVKLDLKIFNELIGKKSQINTENPDDFPLLKNEIERLKIQILIDGCGFFVIDGSLFKNFTINEKKSLHIIISKILGDLLKQNKKEELMVEVKDLGKSMSTGARYHHTNEGSSYHTDGSHIYSKPPNYVGLLCVNPAKIGGASKFISGYTIHNMLQQRMDLLEILYERFYHDKKGENDVGQSPAQFEPVFEFVDGYLKFKYQRELINTGHEKMNKPLSEKQIEALDFLDKILKTENIVVTYELKTGDFMFSNNSWLIHDRTKFEDYEDGNLKRTLVRTWIRERGN